MRRNSPTPNFKSKEFIFVHSFQKIGRGVCRAHPQSSPLCKFVPVGKFSYLPFYCLKSQRHIDASAE